jgi:two-component system, NarL family, response regulator NreC
VLADEHEMVRRGLKVCLEQEKIEVVGEASDGIQALTLVNRLAPDVIVLGHLLPKLNGIQAARRVSREWPRTRTIILATCADERLVLEALRAGALGYVVKTQAIEELVAAVHRVARGRVHLRGSLARTVVTTYAGSGDAPSGLLSPRECQVLQLIAEGNTTKEIAGVLGISVKTADSHRSRLIKKLDIHDTAGLVRYAIREGITQA